MITATITVDLTRLKKFASAVAKHDTNNPIGKAIKQWAVIYRGFAYRRFDKFSKGGGDWPKLAESTLEKRRPGTAKKIKVSGKAIKTGVAILRDTGMLMNALVPTFTGNPGALEKDIPFGVVVGFGGTGKHPDGYASIADIASFHQVGGGRLPKREIIVDPDATVRRMMAATMQAALKRMQDGNS